MKRKLYIPKWMSISMLIVISITSAGYTYFGDQDGWKVPSALGWGDQIMVWPTALAAQITGDRTSADFLVFIFWFVTQAVVLLCLYIGSCQIVSRPGPGGKDL